MSDIEDDEESQALDELYDETKSLIANLRSGKTDLPTALAEGLSLLRDTQLAMLVFAEDVQDKLDPPIEVDSGDAQEICELLGALHALSTDPTVKQRAEQKIALLTADNEPDEEPPAS